MLSTRFSFATGSNVSYMEEMYEKYKIDPSQVDVTWQKFFDGYEFAIQNGAWDNVSAEGDTATGSSNGDQEAAMVEAYVQAYRVLGHLSAHLNPLAAKPDLRTDMRPENHGLKNVNKTRKFLSANLPGNTARTFDEIQELMQQTYCSSIGAEFRDNDDIEFVKWIQTKMETCRNRPVLTSDQKKQILQSLVRAEGFESFLQARYLGQKRFSLEGAEAFMPLVETIAEHGAKSGVEEIAIGMAHRGRLGTLCNFMGKSYEKMFKKFEGSEYNPYQIDGDVKYHMGFANERQFGGKKVRLYLSPNPSHLEIVNPVVEGFVRSRQRMLGDTARKKVLPLLVHGDAAFIGQGLVAETLNLAELGGYTTGGTIHIIINNQVGFTTDPSDSRSCTYASGIAKLLKAPVLHVNADDPEAVVWCAMLAAEYRQRWGKDFVIDLVGYRRHGHNETDEPSFTQPKMYKQIAQHPTVMNVYGDKLQRENVVSSDDFKKMQAEYRAELQGYFEKVKDAEKDQKAPKKSDSYPKDFEPVFHPVLGTESDMLKPVKTGIPSKLLVEMGRKITSVPKDFTPHSKVSRLLEQRTKMLDPAGTGVDWPMAELLAFASLASEGHTIRLSGQDCQRGTFSSRHAVIRDFETGKPLELLNQLGGKSGYVEILNSPLSELGVMGFDFGYTIADKDALVIWEGQFGDFVNGAQIVIDQFLVASEAKWNQTSGLVLLLPHGYEGMGPEHSSGRPERFLQLCGNANIQVAIPTTAAQYFHILRRQLKREFRKPLIIMSPKSLLRHPRVVSSLSELEGSNFREVIDDGESLETKQVKNIVMCTGKIYYELTEAAVQHNVKDVAFVRIEQLYPFPSKKLTEVLQRYKHAKHFHWCQEEPQNMGAWTFVRPRIEEILGRDASLQYVGRRDSGSTAEGVTKAHLAEQNRIVTTALGIKGK